MFQKYSTLLGIFLSTLFIFSCSKNPPQTNFDILKAAVEQRDSRSFCQNISQSSRDALARSCQFSLQSLWPRLENLFDGAESFGRRGNIFFIQKEGELLSYPIFWEQGRWRADIFGAHGWKNPDN